MQKRFVMIGSLVFLFALSTYAQIVPDCSATATPEQKQKCEEIAQRTIELTAGTRFVKPALALIPETADAWILHLITTGGYTGRGLPTITVRSNGEYACGEDDPLEFKSLARDKFEELSELMTTVNLTVEKGQKRADDNRRDISVTIAMLHIWSLPAEKRTAKQKRMSDRTLQDIRASSNNLIRYKKRSKVWMFAVKPRSPR